MSLKIDRLQLEIVINNDPARKALRELENESRTLTSEMKRLDKSSEDYAKGSIRLKAIKLEMDKIYQSIGLAGLSMKELTLRQKELNNMMRGMDPRLPQYKQLQDQLKAVGGRMTELKDGSKETQSAMGKLGDSFNRYQALAMGVVAVMTGLVMGLRKVVDVFNVYEKSVDNLSALTGLVGRDLKWLSEEAIKMSTAVIEGNIRITSSATEIVDAYTKVGSKRPELLKVKEDLNAVTQEAMILAAAANGELAPAVDGLTMVLNQFNAPASDSRKIINILAAGSKEGAGEIDYLTVGFEKAGSVANTLNVGLEDLTGVLETLAPRITAPEMAGRSLRNIMLILEQSADKKLRPSLVGLGGAFENLRDKQLSTIEMAEIFGRENVNAAVILAGNTAETAKYTAAVTGTNVALEQASINTQNNASKLDQARNRVENISIAFGEKLAPAMTFSTNSFGYFMKAMMAAPDFIAKYQLALIILAGALLAYNASIIKSIALNVYNNVVLKQGIGLRIKEAIVLEALIVKERLFTIWKTNESVATKLAATAQWLWNAAIMANPIGAAILAITSLVVAIKLYDQYSAESIQLEYEKELSLKRVTDATSSLNTVYDNQAIVIDKLNLLSASQKQALYDQTDATIAAAEAELALMTVQEKRLAKENTRTTAWQGFKNALLSGGNSATLVTMNAVDAIENGIESTTEIKEGIATLGDTIKKLKVQRELLSEVVDAESFGDAIVGKSITQLEEKQRYFTIALKNYEKGTADYIRIANKLQAVSKQLESDAPGGSDLTAAAKEAAKTAKEKLAELIKLEQQQIENNDPAVKGTMEKIIALEKLIKAYESTYNALYGVVELERIQHNMVKALIPKTAVPIIKMPKKPLTPEQEKQAKLMGKQTDINNNNADARRQDNLDAGDSDNTNGFGGYTDKDKKDFAIEQVQVVQGAIFDIVKANQQAAFDHKMTLFDKARERELSDKNLTEEQKAKINAKYDAKARKLKQDLWVKQRNADIINSIIAGALGVVKASPVVPLMIAAGIAGAASTAVIASQPVPEFSKGGQTGTGYSFTDRTGQRPAGYVHANEYVIPSWERNIPEVMHMESIIEAIRLRGFAAGGSVSSTASAPSQPSATSTAELKMLGFVVSQLTEAVTKLQSDGIQANVSYQNLKKMQDKVSLTESRTSL